jgi:hypothetical protein
MGTLFQCNIKSGEALSVQELPPVSDSDDSPERTSTTSAPPETTGTSEELNDLELLGQDPVCDACFTNPRRKCRECGCNVCGTKDEDPENIGKLIHDWGLHLSDFRDITDVT